MKNENSSNLPLTIARLVRSASPVRPLAPPSVRLARWAITSTCLALLSVIALGARLDFAAQMWDGWFAARAAATLAIALTAAAAAFSLSVPGVEPPGVLRAVPFAACLVWAAMLIATIAATPSPLDLLLRVAPHPACVLFIAATACVPAVLLVHMLRHAAPLQARWTSGCAGLASVAVGALGTQFVCTNDAAAHHLLWHFTPVVLLALASVWAGPSLFAWSHRRPL